VGDKCGTPTNLRVSDFRKWHIPLSSFSLISARKPGSMRWYLIGSYTRMQLPCAFSPAIRLHLCGSRSRTIFVARALARSSGESSRFVGLESVPTNQPNLNLALPSRADGHLRGLTPTLARTLTLMLPPTCTHTHADLYRSTTHLPPLAPTDDIHSSTHVSYLHAHSCPSFHSHSAHTYAPSHP
jgi:hypothetical protein